MKRILFLLALLAVCLGVEAQYTQPYYGTFYGNGAGLTNLQGNGAAFTNLPIVPANNSVSYLAYSNLASWGNSLIKGSGQGNITTNGSTGITATNFGWLKYWANSSPGNDLPTLANNTIFAVSSGNIRSGSNGTAAFGTIKNIEGGINDAANGSFNIAYFQNVLTAAAADLVLHPNLDSTQATTGTGIRFDLYDLYNNGTYVSPNGKMYGTLTGTHFNYNGYGSAATSSEYGLWSSNQTDSISWTNVIGPSFYAFYMMGTGSMSAGGYNIGTNVYYVNGVSNCTVPCNVASYSAAAWSYGVQVFTNLPYGPNIITCSNYTACAVGYSGTNMTAMTFAWGACPAQFQWIDPIYIWGTHYPTSTSYNTNFIASQNVAQQQVAALLKSTGIPAAYVSSAAIGTNISPDNLHPSDQGYTNFANVLTAAIAANSAWAGVFPLPNLISYAPPTAFVPGVNGQQTLVTAAGNNSNYVEMVVGNLSPNTNASAGFVLSNANTTTNTWFAELGYNGSGFTNAQNPPGGSNDAYIITQGNSTNGNPSGGTNGNNIWIGTGPTNSKVTIYTGSGNGGIGIVISNNTLYGSGAGLTNTFNGSTNTSIAGTTSGVTNTATKYGTCVVVSTAGTYSNFDAGGNWLFTNASVTGEETWQVGPGAGVKSITAGITSCKIIFQ